MAYPIDGDQLLRFDRPTGSQHSGYTKKPNRTHTAPIFTNFILDVPGVERNTSGEY